MEIVKLKLTDIYPYPNNPRINDHAVDAVAESIRQCSYVAPIIVDENHVILAGHTRHKALSKLGYDEAEVIIKAGLTEEQKRKYRLLDNKTGEAALWDFDLLETELDGLDFDGFDFGFDMPDDSFDENDLDDDRTKENVIVSINIQNMKDYEAIKGGLQSLTDSVNASMSVKMG